MKCSARLHRLPNRWRHVSRDAFIAQTSGLHGKGRATSQLYHTTLNPTQLSSGGDLIFAAGGNLPLPASPLFTRVSSLPIFKPSVYAGFQIACPQTPY